jgi:hypothetical protein
MSTRLAAAIVCVGVLAGPAIAQFERRVTIVTTRNETIDGLFVSASGHDVLVRVAGQPLRVPFDSISTLSFDGRGRGPERRARARRDGLDGAFDALREIDAATKAGMLRQQYSDVVVSVMPDVEAFLRSADGWDDVRLALGAAAARYDRPLQDAPGWLNAEQHWREASMRLDYAERLARNRSERQHRESPEPRSLTLGAVVDGRIGTGDQEMPPAVDRSTIGAFNDVWRLEVAAPTALVIAMTSDIFQPHLTLVDANGRQVDGDMGYGTRSEIRKTVPPGSYTIWAGAAHPQEIGTYSLAVRAR